MGINAFIYAQVDLNQTPTVNTSSNAFIDASANKENFGQSIGRGINFPQTDLSVFTLDVAALDGIAFPNYYDGMIVYNTNNGGSTSDPSITQTTNLKPGFYYFFNPNGVSTQSISEGKWVRIDGGNAAPAVPNSLVATGTFTHNGGNSAVLSAVPKDIKAITGIKIVRTDDNGTLLQGGVAATTFYSYDKANKTMVFGQGVMSTSMPAGTYSYVIEYTK
ncbi:hypothetical protein ACFFUE_09740 [Bergeyella porcorum]|uniref:hypothetical protein n=1 Tax=Bergeyella porcorum TaxID=1735111 RepID=UPI0035F05E32